MVVFPCFYWGKWWSTKGSTGIVMVSEAMTNHGVTGHKPSPNWGCLLGICIRLFGMAFKWLLDMICFGICDVWICMISYWGLGSYWPALVRWHMLVLYWNWKMPQFVDELLYFNNCDRHLPGYSTGGPQATGLGHVSKLATEQPLETTHDWGSFYIIPLIRWVQHTQE
jgi:hypothetical protein